MAYVYHGETLLLKGLPLRDVSGPKRGRDSTVFVPVHDAAAYSLDSSDACTIARVIARIAGPSNFALALFGSEIICAASS